MIDFLVYCKESIYPYFKEGKYYSFVNGHVMFENGSKNSFSRKTFEEYLFYNPMFENKIVEVEEEDFRMSKYAIVFNSREMSNEYYGSEDSLNKRLLKICVHDIKHLYKLNERNNDFEKVINLDDYTFSKKAKCAVSGQYFSIKNMTFYDGVGMVANKHSEVLAYCDHCHRYEVNAKLTVVKGGKKVCSECLRRSYRKCDSCGQYEQRGNFSTFYTDEDEDTELTICQSCVDEKISNGELIRCRQCGRIMLRELACHDTRRDQYFCNSCYDDITPIMGYHHTHGLDFIKADGETTKRYFGIELEIGGVRNGAIRNDVADYAMDIIKYLECKGDSSIEHGFEMVTNPMTYKYLMSITDKWEELLSFAVDKGFKSDVSVNCGMHIHISRNSFVDDGAIDRVCQLFEAFWDNVFEFSKREESQLNWCGRYWGSSNKLKKSALKELTDDADDRYMAVNLTNDNTVEFRIFNGTLSLDTFYANIQFINRVCDVVNGFTDEEFDDLTWDTLVNGNSEYTYLINYAMDNHGDSKIGDIFQNENDDSVKEYKGILSPSEINNAIIRLSRRDDILQSLPVGSRVRIGQFSIRDRFDDVGVAMEMVRLRGRWFTIKRVAQDSRGRFRYYLDDTGLGGEWTWTIEMFDNYYLPSGFDLGETIDLLDSDVPYGFGRQMILLNFVISSAEYENSFDLVKYQSKLSTWSYNNFMFKKLSLLNLKIHKCSYSNFDWLT